VPLLAHNEERVFCGPFVAVEPRRMPIHVVAEQQLLVGQPTVIEGAAPEGSFVAVFEDDGETAYFYAVDRSLEQSPIRDAVHVYDVAQVTDREKPSTVSVGWSVDNQKVVLLINDYPHAIFDFQQKQGFCRSGFPPPLANGEWSTRGHEWDGSANALFR
jgi:hypothetical protein